MGHALVLPGAQGNSFGQLPGCQGSQVSSLAQAAVFPRFQVTSWVPVFPRLQVVELGEDPICSESKVTKLGCDPVLPGSQIVKNIH